MTRTQTARRVRGTELALAAQQLIDCFQSQRPMRAGSLLVSIFGDAIAPHGGTVWLGSLIAALEPFGVNQRLVRTSVFRLTRDGWFSSEQIGRRSYYSLTPAGRRRFDEASRHIYSEPRRQWSGRWCLVLLSGVAAARREPIRRELGWLGFAPFSANLLAHPEPDMAAVEEHLDALPGNEALVVSEAVVGAGREKHFGTLVRRAWALDELDQRYREFVTRFRPVYRAVRPGALDPLLAFQIRALLIHEYRKIVLRDPLLPEALLPANWSGLTAYQLCRNLYRALAPESETYLTEEMETADGPLPPADPGFHARFGGLQTDQG